MTTTKQQKIRVGLFAVVAGALFGVVLVVFAGLHFWQSRSRYYIVFDDTVYGLEKGADVHVNGIRVGTVSGIGIAPDDLKKVRVEIEIREDAPVRTDTKAILQYAGLTGLKVIDLRGGSLTSPRLAPGGIIPVGETAIDKLQERAQRMVDESTELIANANEIVSSTQQVVTNLTEVTDPKHLGEIVEQTRAAAANLAQVGVAMRALIDDNRAGLKSSIAAIETAAKRTAELVDPTQVKAAVSDLRQASRSFKELAREVRQKPSRLFFSNPAPDRKLP
ncbi:MAG: MCE family protein [Kofleriaceae bacterium]|nr:MCE family protein [Kofleriaceae bacterium]